MNTRLMSFAERVGAATKARLEASAIEHLTGLWRDMIRDPIASVDGLARSMMVQAMLSVAVQIAAEERSPKDLAAALRALADELDGHNG